jgi:hypothetical protein
MRRNNSAKRTQRIYNLYKNGEGAYSTEEITKLLGEKKGTISPFISAMVATGNLIKFSNGLYKLPKLCQNAEWVANDIKNYYRESRERVLARKIFKAEKLKNLIDEVASETPAQLSIDVEKNFKDIAEKVKNENWDFERVDSFHIDEAVKLLKSKGYKILAPVTEFKEI